MGLDLLAHARQVLHARLLHAQLGSTKSVGGRAMHALLGAVPPEKATLLGHTRTGRRLDASFLPWGTLLAANVDQLDPPLQDAGDLGDAGGCPAQREQVLVLHLGEGRRDDRRRLGAAMPSQLNYLNVPWQPELVDVQPGRLHPDRSPDDVNCAVAMQKQLDRLSR
eukprot:scaffold5173_cov125-Isochrysis_galbana.AAC.6